jgi:hypothetical protein
MKWVKTPLFGQKNIQLRILFSFFTSSLLSETYLFIIFGVENFAKEEEEKYIDLKSVMGCLHAE